MSVQHAAARSIAPPGTLPTSNHLYHTTPVMSINGMFWGAARVPLVLLGSLCPLLVCFGVQRARFGPTVPLRAMHSQCAQSRDGSGALRCCKEHRLPLLCDSGSWELAVRLDLRDAGRRSSHPGTLGQQ